MQFFSCGSIRRRPCSDLLQEAVLDVAFGYWERHRLLAESDSHERHEGKIDFPRAYCIAALSAENPAAQGE
jgi:hypothetical protein